MLGPEGFCHPDHLAGAGARCVGQDLAQVRVVGLFELVLDDDLLLAAGTQDVELEVAHPILGGDQGQLGQPERVGQGVEVVFLG